MKLLMENWNNYLTEQQFRDEFIQYITENNITFTEEQLNEVNWKQIAQKFATPAALMVAMAASNPALGNDDFGSMFDDAMQQGQSQQADQADVQKSQSYGIQLAQLALQNTPNAPQANTPIAIGGHLRPSAAQTGLSPDAFSDAYNEAYVQGLVKKGYNVVEVMEGSGDQITQAMRDGGYELIQLKLNFHDRGAQGSTYTYSLQGPGIDKDQTYQQWTPQG